MLNIDDNFWIAFKISQDRMYAFWKPDNQTFFGIEAFDYHFEIGPYKISFMVTLRL